MNINVRKMPDGNLKITADSRSRRDIREEFNTLGYWSTLMHAFEPYYTNGMYEPFDAGDGDPFVGLSSAPCIAESLTYEDDGSKTIDGGFWYFENYMLENDLETLWRTGRVIYSKPR